MLGSNLSAVGLLALLATAAAAAPVALTDGPGDEINAAWTPHGTRVVFQRILDAESDLLVLDLDDGSTRPLVTGPGRAIHPCISPDGERVVYSWAHFTTTAAQGLENGYSLLSVPIDGGEPTRLTEGVVRDVTPTFSPDGRWIYFATTRGSTEGSLMLMRMPAAGGELEPAGPPHARDVAWSQPDLSPDGSVICCGYLGGFRSNWTLHYVRPGAPEEENPLTSPDIALYDPAWSPDGQLIACTGFAAGDPGWGIYVLEPTTGQRARLDAGEGNCRHPVWSPDGSQIIFESNRGGTYDLYRMPVPEVSFPEADGEAEQPLEQVLALSFEDGGEGDEVVPDLSGSGNDGHVVEELTWTDDGARFGDGFVAVPEPTGCDFGTGAFSVMAEVTILSGADETRIVMVGDYPEHHLGWQIFVNAEGYGYFNARSPGGGFIGPRSSEPLPHGQRIRLTGVRHAGGECELYVDGVRQRPSVPGGTMQYGDANRIHVGAQYNGGMRFDGIIHRVEVHRGSIFPARISAPVLREFLGR